VYPGDNIRESSAVSAKSPWVQDKFVRKSAFAGLLVL
jgi:hypothetical protein